MNCTAETYSNISPVVFYGEGFCCGESMHNITSKKQHVAQTDVAFEGNLLAGYELEYNYRTDKPHQLEYINDNNYRTADSTAVASSTKAISDAYLYDSNGNLIFVNSNDSVQTNLKERKLSWDEENRLRSICDNGYVSSYFYDAAGERTVKLHGGAEGIHVNSAFSGGYTNNADYTLYVNAYMVLEKGGQYTKHIYIGDQRIVSKLGDVGSFGVDPRREQYAGEDVAGVEVPNYKTKYEALQEVIKDNYQLFEVDYYGIDNDNYVNGEGFCCDDSQLKTRSVPTENVDYEKLQYYYHSDHLGSASYITNLDGEVVQHIEYVPFGEVFLEERNNTWNTPFLFNGKELDEETGLYYYGARYYNPRISLWYGVDPLAEDFPAWTPYHYVHNNPINLIDPDGRAASTDVTKNDDGTYTVVGAYDDGDNNIYVVDGNRNRTGETIGTTMQPTDFMNTNDATGEFSGYADVTFDLNKLTVSGTVSPNDHTTSSIYGADAQRLLNWGQELFKSEVERQSPATFYGALEILKQMSVNYKAENTAGGRGSLDFKSSLGLNKYTAISAGNTSDGKPIITTLRAMGNMIFGANMRSTKSYLLGSPTWYYGKVMNEVGAYNQSNNGGNGYNKGFPYYGEHTYSGSYIYYGYFGNFHKK